jgi:hypothetical protein
VSVTEPHDPLRYLALARELAASSADETRHRTATGRAYYALFLVIREWTGVHDQRTVHTSILQELGRRGQQGIGAKLYELRRRREAADYQPLPTDVALRDWAKNWQVVDEHATWLVNRLQHLSVLPAPGDE